MNTTTHAIAGHTGTDLPRTASAPTRCKRRGASAAHRAAAAIAPVLVVIGRPVTRGVPARYSACSTKVSS